VRRNTRLVLLAIGILIVAYDCDWFTQAPGWLSVAAAFFLLVPAILGGARAG
jgi:hypothetical protein